VVNLIRDDLSRGVSKEFSLLELIKKYCDVIKKIYKNPNIYDIDLIVELKNNKEVLLEIEETSRRNWPEKHSKPDIPSKLFTMPLRKIKYFIKNGDLLEKYLIKNSTISSISEFNTLYAKGTRFELNNDKIRIYIKGSYNLKKLCVIKSRVILKSLNNQLSDQIAIKKRIKEISDWNGSWTFQNNLWENKLVKNYENEIREDPILLIVGHVDKENDLIWIEDKDICKTIFEHI
jgi:hypothetical protein